MKQFVLRFCLCTLAVLLRVRYKITYKGLDQVKALLRDPQKGCLFLPNHPAVLVDPLIVSLPLVTECKIRPLIIEYMYHHPAFHWAVRLLNALPMPNFGSSFSSLKLKRAERSLDAISTGLTEGGRFLIYPSGTTKLQAVEVVGGAFGVHKIVAKHPEVPIVLVRITGLWGSAFSRAPTYGAQPHTKETVKKGFWVALKNLIFFVPKRQVLVEFEVAPSDFPRNAPKQEFNRYLEAWYNKPFGAAGEPLSLVSYAFWKDEFVAFEKPPVEVVDISSVPDSVKKQVVAKIAELAKIPANRVLPELKLIEHLGLDSLDHAELIAFLEAQFNVTGVAPEKITTVASVMLQAVGTGQVKEQQEANFALKGWNKKRAELPLEMPEGSSIPELFIKTCDAHLFEVATYDPIMGSVTYYTCKKVVLLLAEQIKKLKGERIGILLPASTLSYLLVLACQMANKTPVMINWTVGGKHLDTVVDVSKIEVVLSSWAFLDALDTVDISRIEPLLLVIEELKAEISLIDLAKASLKALLRGKVYPVDSSKEAVILFTSGTESMPKGVGLTHENILFDLRASLKMVPLFQDDALLAMLPPFHSFGFTVTGLLPLVSALRVAYYPNPTDSKRLAHALQRLKITVVASAPTFLKNIMQFCKGLDLSSLRMVISGAEKAPDELFSQLSHYAPQALFVEGYGITECSPVLAVNISGDRNKGVGKPLGGVELLIVDPENLDRSLGRNEVGLILARGPNVFSGYLNKVSVEPFVQYNTLQWYQTGDLGMLDSDGNLILSGRLKRFVKIGGEMVSLTAIEETLSHQTNLEPDHYTVMTDGDVLGKVLLVLFTTQAVDAPDVNMLLRKGGLSALVKIDRVVHLKEIPKTATGKVAYRELDKILKTLPPEH